MMAISSLTGKLTEQEGADKGNAVSYYFCVFDNVIQVIKESKL